MSETTVTQAALECMWQQLNHRLGTCRTSN